MEQQKQPKIVQKLLLRTFFLLLAVAGVFLGIQYILKWRKDPDSGPADTNQMVAAIQLLDEGQQAVIFAPSGKVLSPDYVAGKSDRDISWLPDGNRLYFSSDRKERAYNLFRWNPATNEVSQKSTGTLSKFDPSFPVITDHSDTAALRLAGEKALITQGGVVLEYNLQEATSQQVLPPAGGVTVGAEEGSGGSGQFDSLYKKYGNAFRTARRIGNGDYMAAVMKGDEQETLIIQKMVSEGKTQEEQMMEMVPRPVMAGDRIDIDVDPATGKLIFTVLNFQFPDREKIPERSIKNGKIVKDFIHGVFVYDPTASGAEAITPIALSIDGKAAYGPAVVSPTGDRVALTSGTYDGDTYTPLGLLVAPAANGGIQSAAALVRGPIYEYSWHPTGDSLVYIKREGGKRVIYKINKDGSAETKVSDDGNYMTPKFSPQSK